MKVIIVEDDFIVADHFKLMLKKYDIEVAAIIDNAEDAIENINTDVDVYFIDIRLRGQKTGLDLGEELNKTNTPFVYVSANNEIPMLKKAALTSPESYITKPYRESDVVAILEILKTKYLGTLLVKTDHGKKAIKVSDVLYIEAEGAYIKIVTKETIYKERDSINKYELEYGDTLIRIHRSFLVNKDYVDQFNYTTAYINGQQIPISRHYKDVLKNIL